MEIQSFIETFRYGTLNITPTVRYDVREVIEDNIRLMHGQFVEPTFSDGSKKNFYNIGWVLADTIYRNTDLDTKDVKLHSLNGEALDTVALLRMGVAAYLRETNFGEFLNDARRELINMGHVVVKIVDGEPHIVNLLNLIVPPYLTALQDGEFVERTFLTYEQMLENKEAFQSQWSKIEELRATMMAEGQQYFTVYEHWKVDEFEGKIQKGCIKYLDMTLSKPEKEADNLMWAPYEELVRFSSPYEKKIRSAKRRKALGRDTEKVYPYVEQRFVKMRGRWLGFGIFELTKGIMEDYNEKMNLKRKFDKLALRGILVHKQSADPNRRQTLTQEFLNNVDTGAAIDLEPDEDLQRLNLGSMTMDVITSVDKLFELARQVTGTTAQGTLESTPATQTATVAVMNQKTASSTYDVVIEQQELFLKELFGTFLLPEIVENFTAAEWVQITGDPVELNEFQEKYITNYVNNKLAAFAKAGHIVTDQVIEDAKRQVADALSRQGNTRMVQFTQEMLKSLDYDVEFNLAGESFETNTMIQNIIMLLKDPNFAGSRKKLESYLLDLMGLSGKQFEKSPEELQQELAVLRARANGEQGMAPGGQAQTPANQFAQANTNMSGMGAQM